MDQKHNVKGAVLQIGSSVAHRGACCYLWTRGKGNFIEKMTSELGYGAK